MFETIILTILFLFLCITSYSDIKTREVPDWINFVALASAIGLRLLYSTLTWNYHPILSGTLGFLAFYILSSIMFYTGQWGGGDSKLLMAIGTFLGLEFDLQNKLFAFLVSLVITGAIYGTLWSFFLAIKNTKKFVKKLKSLMRKKQYTITKRLTIILSLTTFSVAVIFNNDKLTFTLLMFIAISITFFFYLFIFVKAIENCCMIKLIEPKKLTEGDWIAKDIIINGKKICGPKDVGLTKSQIKKLITLKLQGKINKVLLKTGIPFVPSFLLAFLFMLKFGNILLKFI